MRIRFVFNNPFVHAAVLSLVISSLAFGGSPAVGVTTNAMDQWISLITNVGLPIAIIILIYRDFVRPLGGENGIIAKYFDSQTVHSSKQTELIGEQRTLTKQLSDSIVQISDRQIRHIDEARVFINKASVDLSDLVRIHGLIAHAMRKEFTSDEAKSDLVEVDRIVDKYIRRDNPVE